MDHIKINNNFFKFYLNKSLKSKNSWLLLYILIDKRLESNNSKKVIKIEMLNEYKNWNLTYNNSSYEAYKYFYRAHLAILDLTLIEKNTIDKKNMRFGEHISIPIFERNSFSIDEKIITAKFNESFVTEYLVNEINFFQITKYDMELLLNDKIAVKTFPIFLYFKANVYINRTIKIHMQREDLWKRFNLKDTTPFIKIKERYLTPIIQDINDNTYIDVKVSYLKKGNKITTVEFLVKHNKNNIKSSYEKKSLLNFEDLNRTQTVDVRQNVKELIINNKDKVVIDNTSHENNSETSISVSELLKRLDK